MRLTDEERRVIREAVAEVYGPNAIVRLFGSRVHDELRGGDVDLHVEADDVGQEQFPTRKTRLWTELQYRLGEQRVDIVETRRGCEMRPIERIAYSSGVEV